MLHQTSTLIPRSRLENFERLKNREDSSDFDDFLTKSLATTSIFIPQNFVRIDGALSIDFVESSIDRKFQTAENRQDRFDFHDPLVSSLVVTQIFISQNLVRIAGALSIDFVQSSIDRSVDRSSIDRRLIGL